MENGLGEIHYLKIKGKCIKNALPLPMKMRNYIARLLALLTAKQHLYQTANLHSRQITSLEFLQRGAREAALTSVCKDRLRRRQ